MGRGIDEWGGRWNWKVGLEGGIGRVHWVVRDEAVWLGGMMMVERWEVGSEK